MSPLLSQLSPGAGLEPAQLEEVVDLLHLRLRERNCFGRSGGVAGSRQRSEVLRVVFSLLDSPAPSLLVKLAHIIISVSPAPLSLLNYSLPLHQMEVTGKNLLNVCKLLFSLARTDTNDTLFSTEAITGTPLLSPSLYTTISNQNILFLNKNVYAGPLLGMLGQCDAVSDSEALVYGVGTVKLLASNHDLRPQLVENGALSLLQSLLSSHLQLVEWERKRTLSQ